MRNFALALAFSISLQHFALAYFALAYKDVITDTYDSDKHMHIQQFCVQKDENDMWFAVCTVVQQQVLSYVTKIKLLLAPKTYEIQLHKNSRMSAKIRRSDM